MHVALHGWARDRHHHARVRASVHYWCAGTGSPGVLLEAGTDSGGTDAYPAAFVDPLVAETTGPDDLRAEGFVWTDNPEFVDYVDHSEELDTLDTPIGTFPVPVISATEADSPGARNQRHWLRLSPHSRQVVIEGPHDLQEVAPEEVVAEILQELRGL